MEADYYQAANNMPASNRYLKAYIALNDSVELSKKKLIKADFNKELKTIEQEQSLSALKKDAHIKTLYLGIAAAFLLLAIFIALLIWYNRKRLQLMNAKISAQNTDMHITFAALEQSQEENTRLMKIVAHDLRSPMSITISIVNILLENKDLKSADKEMLELMKTSSAHSLEMIVDLLNMNTTKEELKKESVEIHTLLKYCINMLNFRASEKEQLIVLQTEEAVLEVNREKIWRVVSNLIVNAIKFSAKGAPIEVNMHKEKDSVLISVQDHGIGIPEALRDNIFNIFTDAKRLGTSGEHSFGLGLAIAKQIIEAHDGKIWFESELNKGSTFFVQLPIVSVLQ